jgi:hypothetical protein
MGHDIRDYGGWYIEACASSAGTVTDARFTGWTALKPSGGAVGDHMAGAAISAYATTSKVPLVPPGSAVEFAVDYAAGTCRVAFYTPAAVAGGFVKAPYAKMELLFVAMEANTHKLFEAPARPVPTIAGSGAKHLRRTPPWRSCL